jgi:hypothetical protein
MVVMTSHVTEALSSFYIEYRLISCSIIDAHAADEQ